MYRDDNNNTIGQILLMQDETEDQGFYRRIAEEVKEKVLSLPPKSHIRTTLLDGMLNEIQQKIESNRKKDLEWGYWPPIFCYVLRHSISQLKSLDSDLNCIIGNSKQKLSKEIIEFLRAKANNDRLWSGGMFEMYVKAQAMKNSSDKISLDEPLPNGKKPDVKIQFDKKDYLIEATVITDSDDDKETWDRFLNQKKIDPNAVLVRPGKYDPPNPKGPSLYYDTIRLYTKVFDKLTPGLDPRDSQLSDKMPNILCLSFSSFIGPLFSSSPSVGWALDELLVAQPKGGFAIKDETNPVDISLLGWLTFTANDMISKKKIDATRYCEDFQAIITSLQKISAILLFQGCSFRSARINYNTSQACKISHQEVIMFEQLFQTTPDWYK